MDAGVMFDSILDFPIHLLAEKPGFWFDPNSYWAIARVVMGLGFVIFIHELGHFLVAKACGVKCDKFYVGFDAFDIKIGDRVIVPRSLFKWQWGETEYGIGILPLGGYVKMMGQDDNPANYEKELERSRQGSTNTQDDAKLAEVGMLDRSRLDPRSFLAKSVIQRMAIISAGVIFNLISAIFFAAIAFKSGVDFIPTRIGSTQGGSPAWEQNLAGADIKKVGDSETTEYFPWEVLAEHFVFNGDEKPLPIRHIPFGESEAKTTEVLLRKGLLRNNKDLALAGVESRSEPIVGDGSFNEGAPASEATPPFAAGDRIIGISGVEVSNDLQMRKQLVIGSKDELEFTVERSSKTEVSSSDKQTPKELVKIKVKPNPMRELGFSVEWKAIAAIQKGSPAEKAGLKVGDEIARVNGQPRGNLLNFNRRMLDFARKGESVDLEIKRGKELLNIKLNPAFYLVPSTIGDNQPLAIDAIGVAIPLGTKIESIDDNPGTSTSGIQVNDEILTVLFLPDPRMKKDNKNLTKKPINLAKEETSWGEIDHILQILPAGREIELNLNRPGKTASESKIVTARVKTVNSEDYFLEVRGIPLKTLNQNYISESWKSAFQYGASQVMRDIKRVGKTLLKLVRGKISPKNLGGPGTIAVVATSEASEGNSRLLLFLTFLSANLAVVNLLPIPVLDGGHLLFLAYEGIFRRPVNEKTQIILTYVGLAMILSLMIFVITLDIGRISSWLM